MDSGMYPSFRAVARTDGAGSDRGAGAWQWSGTHGAFEGREVVQGAVREGRIPWGSTHVPPERGRARRWAAA